MAPIRIWQIDAFTNRAFAGNPAAVCLLEEPRDEPWMQAMAAEMNLPETAFLVPREDHFQLRWFTPAIEVQLCGHATLASAHALWSSGVVVHGASIHFQTKSGLLTCSQAGEFIELNFPATPATACDAPSGLLDALGVAPSYIGRSTFDKFLVIDSDQAVRSLQPDFSRLRAVPGMRGVIVTGQSADPRYDFISRYFAPGAGIDEDAVTGSAHCCLGPYWGERLGKSELIGFQASRRGGIVRMRLSGDRVILGGKAVTIFRGELASE